MNVSAAIRAYLSEHGPSTVATIAKGLEVKNTKVSTSLSIMRRAEIVSMSGDRKPYVYALLREVAPPISKEEAVRRAKNADRQVLVADRARAIRRHADDTAVHAAGSAGAVSGHVGGDLFVGFGDLVRDQTGQVQEVLQAFLRDGFSLWSTT